MCNFCGVSTSGYYKYVATLNIPEKDEQDYQEINKIFLKGKKKWGYRTITMKLAEKGISMNHKKVQRIMQKYHLLCCIRKRKPYRHVMKKTQEHRTAPNILARGFDKGSPHQKLSTDITYIWFQYRFVYLSTMKDMITGEILAWYMSTHLGMSLVMHTLDNLSERIPSLTGVLIHSDQGFHYTSPQYINRLRELGVIQSMSRKGNCLDNAPIESFFGHLKDEIDITMCHTFTDLVHHIDRYMYYYNYQRKQWGKNKMTPIQYRSHLETLLY